MVFTNEETCFDENPTKVFSSFSSDRSCSDSCYSNHLPVQSNAKRFGPRRYSFFPNFKEAEQFGRSRVRPCHRSFEQEKAYRSAMDCRKFREVKELSETLQSTINAESKAKLLQMAVSVVKAKRMKSHAMASESLQARLADEAKMQLVLTKANQVFTGLFFD